MIILITGTSKGIGLETAKLLCDQQHTVIAVSRSKMNFSHHNLKFILGDINDSKTIELCKKYLDENNLPLNVLINNAGMLINKAFEKITYSELLSVFETNTFAPFVWIQHMLPYLKKAHKPHIVNISSMGGITGTQKFPGLSAYSSSKGALSILSECLAEELKSDNITCNSLALGAAQTEMLSAAFPEYKAPLSASQMAEFVAWFATNGQNFFNGKVLPVAVSIP